jgi:hypothetical protein
MGKIRLSHFCVVCGLVRWFYFLRDAGLDEVYECEVCKSTYTVRVR